MSDKPINTVNTPGQNWIDRRSFMLQSAGALTATALVPSLVHAAWHPKAPLRVGVVGLGRHGRSIAAELSSFENVAVASFCDTDQRRLDAGARRAQGVAVFTDMDAMLAAGGLDAIFIATPTHLHRKHLESALNSKLHVYCEAPIAATIEDAQAMARMSRGAGKVVQAGYLARSNPVYDLARSFFRSDSVRDMVSLESHKARKTSLRSPASDPARDRELNWILDPEVTTGLPGEWCSHQFDVFHWFVDRFPKWVSGQGSIRLHNDGREGADTVQLLLAFEDGSTLSSHATLANSYEGEFEILRGTNAAIRLAWTHGWMFKEADSPTQGWEVYANRQQFHQDEGITLIAGATKLAEQGKLKDGVGLERTPLWYGLEAFLKSVSEGEPVKCTMDDALRSTVVGIAAHQAVTSNQRVEITEEMLRA